MSPRTSLGNSRTQAPVPDTGRPHNPYSVSHASSSLNGLIVLRAIWKWIMRPIFFVMFKLPFLLFRANQRTEKEEKEYWDEVAWRESRGER